MNRLSNLLGRFSKLFYVCVLLAVCASCTENLYHEEEGTTPEVTPNKDFSFSPVTECTLSINYDLTGDEIPFMIYSENPVDEDTNELNDSLMPLFSDFTEKDGTYSKIFKLTTGVTRVFLASTAAGVPNCVELEVVNNQLSFDMSQPMTKAALRAGKEHKYPADTKVLGTWDDRGAPDYLIGRATFPEGLLASINATLPSSKNIYTTNPDLGEYVKSHPIQCVKIKEKAIVKMAFITESATMANVLGYYCYPTGNTPADKDQLTKIIAFPCANFSNKSGKRSDESKFFWGALSCGSQIQLKYWNGTEFQDEFPANTTIEFFLATNSFEPDPSKNTVGNVDIKYGESWRPVLYTNQDFNPNKTPQSITLFDQNNKLVALGFEDKEVITKANGTSNSDADFNDAVYTLSTEPASALDGEGMPNLKPGTPSNQVKYGNKGTLAFEDLWPNQGDYDMNDVVIHYNSVVTTSTDKVSTLRDEYTICWSGGTLVSGFGYQLPGIEASAVTSCTLIADDQVTPLSLEGGQKLATMILTDNIRSQVGKTFVVETTISNAKSVQLTPPYNPFIFSGQREKEIHLTNMVPTDAADISMLGTHNDVSKPEEGKYYISKDNFPFAIYIPDVDGFVFKFPKEKVRIDEAYPEFASWVNSNGSSSVDWYKKPNEDKVESTDK